MERICYSGMRHEEGDEEVAVKDCILLASGPRKKDLPYVAKVNSLWENPDDGESRKPNSSSSFLLILMTMKESIPPDLSGLVWVTLEYSVLCHRLHPQVLIESGM